MAKYAWQMEWRTGTQNNNGDRHFNICLTGAVGRKNKDRASFDAEILKVRNERTHRCVDVILEKQMWQHRVMRVCVIDRWTIGGQSSEQFHIKVKICNYTFETMGRTWRRWRWHNQLFESSHRAPFLTDIRSTSSFFGEKVKVLKNKMRPDQSRPAIAPYKRQPRMVQNLIYRWQSGLKEHRHKALFGSTATIKQPV